MNPSQALSQGSTSNILREGRFEFGGDLVLQREHGSWLQGQGQAQGIAERLQKDCC